VRASFAPGSGGVGRIQAENNEEAARPLREHASGLIERFRLNGAAQESNLPSRGLHDLTGFEDARNSLNRAVASKCAPACARVDGLYRGETVDATFTRIDGCEIGRWDRHAFLFPVKPGSL
jgi:hypothetical protein